MSLFDNIHSGFTKSVGNNLANEEDDVRLAKKKLSRLGYFDQSRDLDNVIITKDLTDSVRTFQKDNNLKVDGKMHPEGETE